MKKLSELGISPAPWKIGRYREKTTGKPYSNVNSATGAYVAAAPSDADKRIIAAVPKMYAALWDVCFGPSKTTNCAKCGGNLHGGVEYCSKTCRLYKARAALAEASGEGEAGQ